MSKASRTRRCSPPISCTDSGISLTQLAGSQAWPKHGASWAPGKLGNSVEMSAHSLRPSSAASIKVPEPDNKSTHQSTWAPSPNLSRTQQTRVSNPPLCASWGSSLQKVWGIRDPRTKHHSCAVVICKSGKRTTNTTTLMLFSQFTWRQRV